MADPPRIFDRSLVRQRRRRSLPTAVNFLNEIIAADLADRIRILNRPLRTMAIHGGASALLKLQAGKLRPGARIITSDLVARAEIDLTFDDELLPFAPQSLEAFISILGLESANDVPGILAQIRQALRPDGVFLCAVLGGDTLSELRQAWLAAEASLIGGTSPRVAPFIYVREWGALLQRAGFALPVVDADRRTVRYEDVFGLMHDLRRLGLANAMTGRSRRPLSRRLLSALAQAYRERYSTADGRISATFEIIYLTGWAPHESQQKPLRPGSAAMRLAEALGVEEKKLKRD
jgi:SAM-dependent methyltransferase